jgi:hypothetical protein
MMDLIRLSCNHLFVTYSTYNYLKVNGKKFID